MKSMRLFLYLSMALLFSLAACAPQATPSEPPAAQAAPTETETPTPVPPTATPTLVMLAGPDMAIGSTWSYVDGSTLVAVPAGPFIMGHGGSDNYEHTVTLSDFWIYRSKVTNQQYALCVELGQCTPPDPADNQGYSDFTRLNDPLVGVNYEQAVAYCTFVHGRLPTEAEWEKTARGPDGNIYPWGKAAPACDLLNFNNCIGRTTDVTRYPQGKSYYDALDMAGNVYEWVADWYDPFYYRSSPAEDPPGPDIGQKRSVRSSGYKSNVDQVAAAVRFFDAPRNHRRDLGLRCVVEEPAYFAPFCEQRALYGSAPGGSPQTGGNAAASCHTVSVVFQEQSCKQQSAYVTFTSDDPGAVLGGVDPPGCNLISADAFPKVYECSSSTLATIDSSCSYSGVGEAYCAAHYNYDAATGLCQWDGAGSINPQCPPGYEFNKANQCCTAQPGSGLDYPLCAVGYSPVEDPPGHFKCVSDVEVKPPPHADVLVTVPEACGSTGSSCANYTDQVSCLAAGCTWVPNRLIKLGGTCQK